MPGRLRAILTVLDVPPQQDNTTDWVDELERMVKEDTSEKLRIEDFPRMDLGWEAVLFDSEDNQS